MLPKYNRSDDVSLNIYINKYIYILQAKCCKLCLVDIIIIIIDLKAEIESEIMAAPDQALNTKY